MSACDHLSGVDAEGRCKYCGAGEDDYTREMRAYREERPVTFREHLAAANARIAQLDRDVLHLTDGVIAANARADAAEQEVTFANNRARQACEDYEGIQKSLTAERARVAELEAGLDRVKLDATVEMHVVAIDDFFQPAPAQPAVVVITAQDVSDATGVEWKARD